VLYARRIEAQAPYEGKALTKGAKYLVDGALLSADDLGDDKEALLLEWQSCHAQKMANFHLHREHSGRFAVFPNDNCPGCRVGSVPPAPLPAQVLSPLAVREESKADDDIADFIREFSAHSLLLSRFPRPVLRDGSFPPVALSKLLAQPPCDPAVLSAWFASAFMLFYQLHSVFRPVDSSDLLQLFHRLMHWLQRGSKMRGVVSTRVTRSPLPSSMMSCCTTSSLYLRPLGGLSALRLRLLPQWWLPLLRRPRRHAVRSREKLRARRRAGRPCSGRAWIKRSAGSSSSVPAPSMATTLSSPNGMALLGKSS
jgi:hypothetical protein